MGLKQRLARSSFFKNMASKRGRIVCSDEKCVFCGKCAKTCEFHAITVSSGEKHWSIDDDLCVRCGHCLRACPANALELSAQR